MAKLIGGPKKYAGKTPKMGHQHIHITDELFELRQQLLNEAIREFALADDLRNEWIMADTALKKVS